MGIMMVKIEHVKTAEDERGIVFEPLAAGMLPRQRNVHVVFTQPDCVRGNHYHTKGTEIIVVRGSTLARFRDGQELHETTVGENETVRFVIPHGVSHAFKNTGSKTTAMVAFNTTFHDKDKPDVVRDVLIEQ